MKMLEHPEVTLFKSPLVHIIEHHCRGVDTSGSDEEAAGGNQISFPRFGVYQKRNQLGEFLVDPNFVSFYQKDQPYQVHHPVKSHYTDEAIYDISTIFEISDDLLAQMFKKLGCYSENGPAFQNSIVKVSPTLKAQQYIILNTLNRLQSDEHLEFEEAVLDFLFNVLAVCSEVQLAQFPCCRSGRARNDHRELVEQVKLVIGKDFRQKLSLEDIAQQVHHTPFSLARIFKNHTGSTIHSYLLHTRLLHSLEHIMTGPLDHVGQIGVDLGFSTPSHFSTAFLGEFNLSPTAFRQQANAKSILETSNFLKA